jgi:serine/threonine protein kinase/WD40 repeat protein
MPDTGSAGSPPDDVSSVPPTTDLPVRERPGTIIGPYKLLEQIGEGGFGIVYVAEQQRPLQRRVALKLIKPGMDTREIIARFEQERQALALMDHPHIAKVFDAGMTSAGRPYFVMELVRGAPITDYCDQHQLTPRERLELFVSVCQAIQHAHQKGIIHRDIKPSNVLVSVHEGQPVVKVIDFGVAKALSQQLSEHTIYTQFTQLIGTPLYMSPEQAEMNSLDIDTRSDVYSLGVLLYELITGCTPFDRHRLQRAAVDEVRRIIREEEPPKPSTRISQSGEQLTSIAAQRKVEPTRLSKLVRGELDWIVMKSLEKDRTRRYETANGLGRDVQRYLSNEPVEAGPPGAMYRLRKFALRNKRTMATAVAIALMLLVLAGGATLYAWQQQQLAADRTKLADDSKKLAEEKERAGQKTASDLFDSLIRHSEALRLARQPGYRNKVFENLHIAAALDFPGKNLEPIREQVLACLGDPLGLDPIDSPNLERASPPVIGPKFRAIIAASGRPPGYFAVSPDGHWMFGFYFTEPLKLWKNDGTLVMATSPPMSKLIRCATFTADNRHVAIGSDAGTDVLSVPDLRPYTFMRVGAVHSLSTNLSGQLAILAQGRIELWSLDKNRSVTTFPAPALVGSIDFSRDGTTLLGLAADGKAIAGWPVNQANEKRYLHGHRGGVSSVVFSPDERFLASGGKDANLRVWNVQTGALCATVPHSREVQDVAYSADGRLLATGDWASNVRIFDTRTGDEVANANLNAGIVWRVQFATRANRIVAAAEGGIVWWDFESYENEPRIELTRAGAIPLNALAMAVNPAGSQAAVMTWEEAGFYLCDLTKDPTCKKLNVSSRADVHAVRFDASGEKLRYPMRGGSIGTLALPEGTTTAQTRHRFSGGFHGGNSNERWLLGMTNANQQVALYDCERDIEVVFLPHEAHLIWTVDLSSSGRYIGVGLADGGLAVWNLPAIREQLAEFNLPLEATFSSSAFEPASDASDATFVNASKVIAPQQTQADVSQQMAIAIVYKDAGRFDLAEPINRDAWQKLRDMLGETHRLSIDSENHLGVTLARLAKYDEAERHLLDSYRDIQLAKDVPPSWLPIYCERLAELYSLWKKPDKVEEWLRTRVEVLRARVTPADVSAKVQLIEAMQRLIHHYDNTGKSDETDKWQKELDAAVGRTESLSRSGKAAASSTWTESGFDASRAFDDTTITRWNSSPSDTTGAWVAISWEQPVKLQGVIVREAFDRIAGFKLQSFDEMSSDWHDLYAADDSQVRSLKGGPHTGDYNDGAHNPVFVIGFPRVVETKRLRLQVTSVVPMRKNSTVSIWEIETYDSIAWKKLGEAFGLSAQAHAEQRQWPEALANWRRARETNPSNPHYWSSEALTLLAAGNEAGYSKFCEDVQLRASKDDSFLLSLATFLVIAPKHVSSEKWKEMRSALEELASSQPENVAIQESLGAICYRIGDLTAAVHHLNRALDLWKGVNDRSPNSRGPVMAKFFLAVAHKGLGNSTDAQKWLSSAEQDPERDWYDQLIRELLFEEAKHLIRADAPAETP